MKIYLVGGAVRDHLLGCPIVEKDWVVVGATIADMLGLGYKQVGKEFPVFLHPKTKEEYALARMERKVKPGYKGFVFDTSKLVTLEDDLKRRDLTINAIAQTETGEIIDPFHGKEDIKQRLLRHVSAAFSEDPVRILRVGRFLARFANLGFKVAPETINLMHKMVIAGEVNALVAERVWKEFEKALSEPNPECFFQVLAECDALPLLFPEIQINGNGIKAMEAAVKLTTNLMIRFAALMYPMENQQTPNFFQRYKVPTEFKQLALLTAKLYQTVLDTKKVTAETYYDIFHHADAFRREKRFHLFLTTVKAIATAKMLNFHPNKLLQMLDSMKAIDVHALLKQGYQGTKLAQKLKELRIEAIKEILNR